MYMLLKLCYQGAVYPVRDAMRLSVVQTKILVLVSEDSELYVRMCIVWCMLQLTMSAGSLMCGLLEDSSLFLWMPGSDRAPVVHSTPLNGMKIDAKDWKGWTPWRLSCYVAPSAPISCLFQVA